MAEFDRKEVILIFTFWIFCPTLDMVTDMNMAYRLFRGPSPDLWVSGGMSDKVNEIKHCNAAKNRAHIDDYPLPNIFKIKITISRDESL